jgi:hypothetical protein
MQATYCVVSALIFLPVELLPSLRGAKRRSNPVLSFGFLDCFVASAPRNDGLQRFACADETDGSGSTVTPGGATSSSGTKKSDISCTEGSTR